MTTSVRGWKLKREKKRGRSTCDLGKWAETKAKSIPQIRPAFPGGFHQSCLCSIIKKTNNRGNRFAYLWKTDRLFQIMRSKYCSEINVPTNVFMRHQFVKRAPGKIEKKTQFAFSSFSSINSGIPLLPQITWKQSLLQFFAMVFEEVVLLKCLKLARNILFN